MAIPALKAVTLAHETPVLLTRPTLAADHARVESCLARLLNDTRGIPHCAVPKAMEYSVLGEAQRIRPILALRVARMLGAETEHALRAGAAVEILHCASLVIDDLPCMDDEQLRRGRATAHIEFGESTAILAAFSMVAMAAKMVVDLPATDREYSRLRRFQLALLRTLDCSALVGGQSLDLTLVGAERDAMRGEMNAMKTVPLFQLAVEAGCVSNALGVPRELADFGQQFGLAFQLTDDYLDGELTNEEIPHERYEHCRACLQSFGENAQPLLELVEYLAERANEKSRGHR